MTKLLPCPWCFEKKELLVNSISIDGGFVASVHCLECEAVGPRSRGTDRSLGRDEARKLWNQRERPEVSDEQILALAKSKGFEDNYCEYYGHEEGNAFRAGYRAALGGGSEKDS